MTPETNNPNIRGILRNAPPPESYYENSGPLDRAKVLQNTRANAQLNSLGSQISSNFDSPLDKTNGPSGTGDDRLHWDEDNIERNEQEKSATMTIDEPKTPFQGAVGDSEYYLPDDEEEFSLGEPQVETNIPTQDDRIIREQSEDDDDEEEDAESNDVDESEEETAPSAPETPEERHKRFEEMRKAHYHMKGDVLKHPLPIDEDDNNNN